MLKTVSNVPGISNVTREKETFGPVMDTLRRKTENANGKTKLHV